MAVMTIGNSNGGYCFTITEEYAGKTLLEIIRGFGKPGGLQAPDFAYSEKSCFVTLDGKIIVYPLLNTTVVSAGQYIKVYPLVAGG